MTYSYYLRMSKYISLYTNECARRGEGEIHVHTYMYVLQIIVDS